MEIHCPFEIRAKSKAKGKGQSLYAYQMCNNEIVKLKTGIIGPV